MPVPHLGRRNPGTIIRSLAAARDNARNTRERVPSITFEYINGIHLFARANLPTATSRTRRREALDGISRRVQQLEGFLSQNMLHDAHWEILRLGNHMERADMTTRIIDVRSADLFASHHDLAPFADVQWRSVLRSAYAMQSYNASVRGPVTAPHALEFLFKDERLPRVEASCFKDLDQSSPMGGHDSAHPACATKGSGTRITCSPAATFWLFSPSTKPQSLSTSSNIPRSKQDSINSCSASAKLARAASSVSPWLRTSRGGHTET